MMTLNLYKKSKIIILAVFTFIIISISSISCICPLFSFLENLTGLEVKTGGEIEQEIIIDELIYPGSKVLIQVTGDIERILELVGQYGITFSQEELTVLDNLPEEMREQEISATIYSTLDKSPDVQDYYNSLGQEEWDIQEFINGGQGQDPGSTVLLLASKEERKQAFLLTGTDNNTFIIFIDFDWEILERSGD